MCSKYKLKAQKEAFRRILEVLIGEDLPEGDISPTEIAPIVIAGTQGRKLVPARFGLIPSWARNGTLGRLLLNARGENVMITPAFRDAFRARRCLVPASAFYEWKELAKGGKQPHLIGLAQTDLFAFAGLWDEWRNEDGEILRSFAIVTTEPNDLIKPIHDRMPVILDSKDYATWLDSGSEEQAVALQKPFPAEKMVAAPVERTALPKVEDKQLGFGF